MQGQKVVKGTGQKFDAYKRLAGMRLTEDEQREMFYALGNLVEPKAPVDASMLLDSIGQHVADAAELIENWGKMQGLSSGYRSIDAITHGFLGGELIVLGGYTHRGKTQTAINISYRMAMKGVPVLFITLEMPKKVITSRFMRLGEIDEGTPVFFQHVESLDVEAINDLIVKAKANGCQFVVIDHLHYFARGSDLLGKVGESVLAFKQMAIRYNVPLMLLSQLRRPESSLKKKLSIPSLGDLKESGYIETDADIVLMVHRNMPEDNPADNLSTDFGEVFVAQRKNRNRGMIGSQVATLRHNVDNGVLLYEESKTFGGPSS